jgi:hypothetical protein
LLGTKASDPWDCLTFLMESLTDVQDECGIQSEIFHLPHCIPSIVSKKIIGFDLEKSSSSNSTLLASASPVTTNTSTPRGPSPSFSRGDANLLMRKKHWETVLADPMTPIQYLRRHALGTQNADKTRDKKLQGIGSEKQKSQWAHDLEFSNSKASLACWTVSPFEAPNSFEHKPNGPSYKYGRTSSLLENLTRDQQNLGGNLQAATELSTSICEDIATSVEENTNRPVAALSRKHKRFQCHFCSSTFAQRGDMIRHIRVKGALVCKN